MRWIRFSLLLVASLLTASLRTDGAQGLSTELVGTGFSKPIYVTSPTGDFDRLFVVEQTGQIRIIENGVTLGTPFLDLSALVTCCAEQGLLGLAFYPAFATNGRFFVNYTNAGGDTRVVEYAVDGGPPLTTDVANPTPVQTIFTQDQPAENHNGGNLQFGGDGMLYIATGDGGGGGGANAQDPLSNLGKMIRLDVDLPAPFIPADNPFVGTPGTNDEIWAFGLRHPWRYSFDRATGELWLGDVGGGAREEIDFEAAGDGGNNFGWPCMEGFGCTGALVCTCGAPSLTLPVHDYDHDSGRCAVIGGYVYRGFALPAIQGLYFFADWCSSQVWSYDPTSGQIVERTAELSGLAGMITTFGEDAAGELYMADLGGTVVKVVPACTGSVSNYCVTSPNSVGPGSTISSTGSLSISIDNFSLIAAFAPGFQNGLFFYGDQQDQTPFGDGVLCVGPGGSGIHRLNPPIVITGFGVALRPVSFAFPPASSGPGMIVPGTTWNFQFWYRDPGGPGGTGFNLSNGLAAVFCP